MAQEHVVTVSVVGLSDRCFLCRSPINAVAGIVCPSDYAPDPDDGFIELDECGEILIGLLKPRQRLLRYRVGPLRRLLADRNGPARFVNTCAFCGALQPGFFLHDALVDFLADGGTYDELVLFDLPFPLDALRQLSEELAAG